jgi:hypothetical protein
MTCKECGASLNYNNKSDYCPKCRAEIKRERAERIAELPWYIFDREDPTVAGANALGPRPVDDEHRVIMSKKKFTQ